MAREVDRDLLNEVLDAREQRWNRRMELSSVCDTLISMTLCLPLRYRGTAEMKTLLRIRADETASALHNAGFPVSGREELDGPDGLCIFLLTRGGAEVKRLCVRLEEKFSLGRFLDIDVTCGAPLSRKDLGLPPRRCFVCGSPAAECVSVRKHSEKEIDRAVEAALSEIRI